MQLSLPTTDSTPKHGAQTVWGLGVAGVDNPARVLPFTADADEDVALHALAAIGQAPSAVLGTAAEMLSGTDVEAASAGVVLAKQGPEGARALLRAATSEGQVGVWAVAALGEMPEADVRYAAEGNLSPQLERLLAPMWAARESWLRRHAIDTPLRFLERQTIRHLA